MELASWLAINYSGGDRIKIYIEQLPAKKTLATINGAADDSIVSNDVSVIIGLHKHFAFV
jgi:aspartate 1-decarboxylase